MILTPEEILKVKTKGTLTINEGSPLHNAVISAMNYYAKQEVNKKSSDISPIIESQEIQKANLYAIMSIYLNGSEEVKNGIYDPVKEALTEIQSKYIIIQKDSL